MPLAIDIGSALNRKPYRRNASPIGPDIVADPCRWLLAWLAPAAPPHDASRPLLAPVSSGPRQQLDRAVLHQPLAVPSTAIGPAILRFAAIPARPCRLLRVDPAIHCPPGPGEEVYTQFFSDRRDRLRAMFSMMAWRISASVAAASQGSPSGRRSAHLVLLGASQTISASSSRARAGRICLGASIAATTVSKQRQVVCQGLDFDEHRW